MSVAGEAIHTVLRIQGRDDREVRLHPSLLDGYFRIGGKSYRVWRRETVHRDIPQRGVKVDAAGDVISIPIDPPEWIVMLYLEEFS
jgi:hypothetical protein